MKRLILVAVASMAIATTGCVPELGQAADALNRLSAQIDSTAGPKAVHLKELVDKTALELRGLIHDGEKTGKAITADFMVQWAKERAATFEEIRELSKEVFGDAHVLVGHFQAAGQLVPIQLGNELKFFSDAMQSDMREMLAMTPFGPGRKTLTGYSGLAWTDRAEGYYEVAFEIKDAQGLNLSVGGGDLIAPAKPATGGKVTFRVPITPALRQRFDDHHEMVVGFALVDPDSTKGPKDWTAVRCSGWAQLIQRFSIAYEFRVIAPGTGPKGETRHIDQGPAIDDLVRSAAGSGAELAARHGQIYRAALSRLPAGASRVHIPRQATWSLTIRFPDGTTEVMTSGKLRVQNPFGQVTVTPDLTDDAWTLLIDVSPR